MTTFAATHTADVDSSAVEALSYNENTQELVIDWHDDLYKYSGVSKARYDNLLNAPSVGRAAQQIKRDLGPGEYLGRFGQVNFVQADKAVQVSPRTNVGTETETFSLTPTVESNAPTFKVFFETFGVEKNYTPKGVNTWEEAADAVTELGEMLDQEFNVTGVLVSLV